MTESVYSIRILFNNINEDALPFSVRFWESRFRDRTGLSRGEEHEELLAIRSDVELPAPSERAVIDCAIERFCLPVSYACGYEITHVAIPARRASMVDPNVTLRN
jgi:hypothetical protein